MKIAVCDDDPRDLAQTRAVFDKIKDRFELEVRYFSCGEELISCVENGEVFSLAVLDIYMSGIDGIKTARRLKEMIPGIQTAFLTSSKEFAVDAFDVGALHYVVKPVAMEKLTRLMERFFERKRACLRNFELKGKTKTYSFPILSIQKVTSSNKGVDIYLKNGGVVHIPESFSGVSDQLDPAIFLKISRGLAVNMSHILYMNNEICRFKDGTEALISRKEKNEIRRRYNDYLFENKEDEL